jgi:hypothetical protein
MLRPSNPASRIRKPRRWWPLLLIVALHVWALASDFWAVPVARSSGVVAALLLSQSAEPASAPPKSSRSKPLPQAAAEPSLPEAQVSTEASPQAPAPEVPSASVGPVLVAAAALPALPVLPAPTAATPAPLPAAEAPPKPLPVMSRFPPSMRINFALSGTVKGFGYSGNSVLLWRNLPPASAGQEAQYQMQLDASVWLLGTNTQTSQGRIVSTGLAPARFSNKRPRGSEQAVHVDYDKQLITYSAHTHSTPLKPGAQDRLSAFFQLSIWASNYPERMKEGERISMQLMDLGDAEDWTFLVQGHERLETESGVLDTIKIVRASRRQFDRKIELWLAPATGYLPVHFRLTEENGDYIDQVLRNVEDLPR